MSAEPFAGVLPTTRSGPYSSGETDQAASVLHATSIQPDQVAPLQRAKAAFLAMAFLLAGLSAAARAAPPLSPPRRPRATAAGFFLEPARHDRFGFFGTARDLLLVLTDFIDRSCIWWSLLFRDRLAESGDHPLA